MKDRKEGSFLSIRFATVVAATALIRCISKASRIHAQQSTPFRRKVLGTYTCILIRPLAI